MDQRTSAQEIAGDRRLEATCQARLLRHRLTGITSLTELVMRLQERVCRRIVLRQDGEHGHLAGYSAGVTAHRLYRPDTGTEELTVAEPIDTYMGLGQALHELGHVLIEPNGSEALTRTIRTELADQTPVVSFRCLRDDPVEREVELTAHLWRTMLDDDVQREATIRSGFDRLLSGRR